MGYFTFTLGRTHQTGVNNSKHVLTAEGTNNLLVSWPWSEPSECAKHYTKRSPSSCQSQNMRQVPEASSTSIKCDVLFCCSFIRDESLLCARRHHNNKQQLHPSLALSGGFLCLPVNVFCSTSTTNQTRREKQNVKYKVVWNVFSVFMLYFNCDMKM